MGFKKIGVWKKDNKAFTFSINWNSKCNNLVYGFVIGREIKYIGKTDDTLHKRLMGYKNPGISQNTNIRLKDNILEALINNRIVDIFILIPEEKIYFEGYCLNISAGLEGTLIKEFKPAWNLNGK